MSGIVLIAFACCADVVSVDGSVCFIFFSFSLLNSGTTGRGEASRLGPYADRSAAVVSILWRDRRGRPEHLRHLHVRVRDPANTARPPVQPRVPRQMHRQMAQGII